jgi:hypothetical protein
MSHDGCDRRSFIGRSLVTLSATGAAMSAQQASAADKPAAAPKPPVKTGSMPCGMLGKAKISRLMLGGNLVSGFMHCRDLRYVNRLFRAYVTEEKIFETFRIAEENGVNTVFESGANFVARYNKDYGGHMQIIPSFNPALDKPDDKIKDDIKRKIDSGIPAIYIWGVMADQLIKLGHVDRIKQAVEWAKKHDLPVGVGGHSLQVPMSCEKAGVPCDFYVKTYHTDQYPSATPKELRKEFIWLDGGKGWYDNMWCINPEETVAFMAQVTKPWIAFKILAAGAIEPRQAFATAFHNGADFIAVGMFDFQVKENADLARRLIEREKNRPRPWCA